MQFTIDRRFTPAVRSDLSTVQYPTVINEHHGVEDDVITSTHFKIDIPHGIKLPSDDPLPDRDTFDLPGDDDDNVEMAGSFGRFGEAQREDNGVHFEAGGSGALVEPQSASRQVVIQELPIDFSYLDLILDDSPNADYILSAQHSTDQGLWRSTRPRKPNQAYIDSLASRSFFDSNILQFLFDTLDVLNSLLSAATSKIVKRSTVCSFQTDSQSRGFEPSDWKEAKACVEKDNSLVAVHKEAVSSIEKRQLVENSSFFCKKGSSSSVLSLRWVFKIKHDGTYKATLLPVQRRYLPISVQLRWRNPCSLRSWKPQSSCHSSRWKIGFNWKAYIGWHRFESRDQGVPNKTRHVDLADGVNQARYTNQEVPKNATQDDDTPGIHAFLKEIRASGTNLRIDGGDADTVEPLEMVEVAELLAVRAVQIV